MEGTGVCGHRKQNVITIPYIERFLTTPDHISLVFWYGNGAHKKSTTRILSRWQHFPIELFASYNWFVSFEMISNKSLCRVVCFFQLLPQFLYTFHVTWYVMVVKPHYKWMSSFLLHWLLPSLISLFSSKQGFGHSTLPRNVLPFALKMLAGCVCGGWGGGGLGRGVIPVSTE